MRYRDLELDPFQEEAIRLVQAGRSVLVAAPTGTGKTLVADALVDLTLQQGRHVVYTAPIKALSNQKYREYGARHGVEKVGLITGDLVIRPDAPCRVMTTEILRNMLLSGEDGRGDLADLSAVILDEIHFLDDPERGTAWEELLIYLPHRVRILGLSATVANLEEFGAWLSHVRGEEVAIVQETRRAVPLAAKVVDHRTGLLDLDAYDAAWKRWKQGEGARARAPRRGRGRRRGLPASLPPDERGTRHLDVFEALYPDLSPYLYFVSSRRDAEQLARELARHQRRSLLSAADRRRLSARLDRARAELGESVLLPRLEALYRKGIAFHHAGLHVQLKALVESLYEDRLVQVLYTTSTFALGINMPARSVVLDRLITWDGREMRPLTVREFTQTTGRAGRRGLDDQGHVVLKMDLPTWGAHRQLVRRYLKGRSEPVTSAFALSFNSVVNLLARHGPEGVAALLQRSYLAWREEALARRRRQRIERIQARLEGPDAPPPRSREHRKLLQELARLRSRESSGPGRVLEDFERRRAFLVEIGYLDPDGGFCAGARILQHIQIEEILTTELVLAGLVEELDDASLFGVLTGLTGRLPRAVHVRMGPPPDLARALVRVGRIRRSQPVRGAERITGQEATWDAHLAPVGRAWAEGRSLDWILDRIHSPTDFSGQLVSNLRRAKDLLGQLRRAHADLPDTAARLARLARAVSRDEVEVVA